MPEDKAFKIEENEKILDILGKILQFNKKIHLGQGLKNADTRSNV